MLLADNVFQEIANANFFGLDILCTGKIVYEEFYLRFSHESYTSVNVNRIVL